MPNGPSDGADNRNAQDSRQLRILHLADHHSWGGASRAATRIHRSLEAMDSVESQFLFFSQKEAQDFEALGYVRPLRRLFSNNVANRLGFIVRHHLPESLRLAFDFFFIRSHGLEERVQEEAPDLVVVHWVRPRDVPLRSIYKLGRPVAVILHDARFILGVAHYPHKDTSAGITLTWAEFWFARLIGLVLRKQRVLLISPSGWIQNLAAVCGWKKKSLREIPYPLDTKFWRPEIQATQPATQFRVAFGYFGEQARHRKGDDIFQEALSRLSISPTFRKSSLEVVFFGDALVPTQVATQCPGITLRHAGQLDDSELRSLLSNSSLLVVPSRTENLGQLALEAQSCGTFVVVADRTGLESTIGEASGKTFRNGSAADLAATIVTCINEVRFSPENRKQVRSWAKENFSEAIVAERYFATLTAWLDK